VNLQDNTGIFRNILK